MEIDEPEKRLMAVIKDSPGIRYQELLRKSNLPYSIFLHHLKILESANAIKVDRRARITRYYPAGMSNTESEILVQLRSASAREIVLLFLKKGDLTFKNLVDNSGKAPSTVSFHLGRLRKAGMLNTRHFEHTTYGLKNPELIKDILSRYNFQ